MPARHILSVGQCFADHSSIRRTFGTNFDADVVPAATAAEALDQLRQQSFDLILVNRVLDADGSSGMDLVGQLKADEKLSRLPVMLVSNHEEAQQQAVDKGALPGFGKASLGHPAMLARLKSLLG